MSYILRFFLLLCAGSRKDTYLEFNRKLRIKKRSEFSIEIKTTAEEGIIFYTAGEMQTDFIALFMIRGQVKTSSSYRRGQITLWPLCLLNCGNCSFSGTGRSESNTSNSFFSWCTASIAALGAVTSRPRRPSTMASGTWWSSPDRASGESSLWTEDRRESRHPTETPPASRRSPSSTWEGWRKRCCWCKRLKETSRFASSICTLLSLLD